MNHLRVMHQNIRCLNNKTLELEVIISENNVDVLFLSEHWQSSEELQSINLSNYKLVSFSCREAYRHGGVALFSKRSLHVEPRSDITRYSVLNSIEVCGGELYIPGKNCRNIVFIVLYRPPLSDLDIFLEKLSCILDLLQSENKLIVMGGDFNINFLTSSTPKQHILDLCSSHNLVSVINVPTRVCNNSVSCIDNFFVNLDNNCFTASCSDYNLSDHYAQELDISILLNVYPNNEYVYKSKFCVNSLNKFNSYLEKETWLTVH